MSPKVKQDFALCPNGEVKVLEVPPQLWLVHRKTGDITIVTLAEYQALRGVDRQYCVLASAERAAARAAHI